MHCVTRRVLRRSLPVWGLAGLLVGGAFPAWAEETPPAAAGSVASAHALAAAVVTRLVEDLGLTERPQAPAAEAAVAEAPTEVAPRVLPRLLTRAEVLALCPAVLLSETGDGVALTTEPKIIAAFCTALTSALREGGWLDVGTVARLATTDELASARASGDDRADEWQVIDQDGSCFYAVPRGPAARAGFRVVRSFATQRKPTARCAGLLNALLFAPDFEKCPEPGRGFRVVIGAPL